LTGILLWLLPQAIRGIVRQDQCSKRGLDIHPIEASRTGADVSICGDCPHRGIPNPNKTKGWAEKRGCYVNLAHGPASVWQAYRRGSYDVVQGHKAIAALGMGQMVRLGTYGDPSAVPGFIWDSLLSQCEGWTAYTHGKVNPDPERIMTSADSLAQAQNAWDRGERTFRVVKSVSDLVKGQEVLCPATCQACKLCAGASVKGKSIAIPAHGSASAKRNARESIQ